MKHEWEVWLYLAMLFSYPVVKGFNANCICDTLDILKYDSQITEDLSDTCEQVVVATEAESLMWSLNLNISNI